jgi:hypothetical protein
MASLKLVSYTEKIGAEVFYMRQEQRENLSFGQPITDGLNRGVKLMRIFIVASFAFIVGCSVNDSAKTMNLHNENTSVSNQTPDVPNKNSQVSPPSAVEYRTSKELDCNDPKGYRLEMVDNPSRADPEHEGDFIPKDVNIIVDNSIVGKIEVPTGWVVKNFSLNSMDKTRDGFVIGADWGGWQNHYELKYYFVCKDRNFFFYALKVNRINGKDPGDLSNWEKKEIKIEPNIPIEKFSILDYLGNE